MNNEQRPNKYFKIFRIAKIFLISYSLIHLLTYSLFSLPPAFANDTHILKAGISIDKVPIEFFGTWRVSSSLLTTNAPSLFKQNTVDLWNLSRANDVITLDNPFTGAHASIMVEDLNGKSIRFKKIGDYDGKKLTDTVQLTLAKETFTGTNTLKFDTISEIDGHVMKSEIATYRLSGEKISGQSIKE